MKRIVLLVYLLAAVVGLKANNVQIVEDVKIGKIEGGFAEVTFKISWENSWRDDFNWDAVYLFMKTKRKTDVAWKHAYFADDNNRASVGFACWPTRYTTTANLRQGVFVYRDSKGRGDAEVTVTLRWNFSNAGYSQTELESGDIEMSLQCIEMVYVPQGAYYLGDGVSKNTLKKKFRQILPEWDILDSHDSSQKFSGTLHSDAVTYHYNVKAPANRVNDTYYGNGAIVTGNMFHGTADGFWQVEFAAPKRVRYFGISGSYGHTGGHIPNSWYLEGSVDGTNNWKILTETYGPSDWPTEPDSYPVYHALPVKPEMVGDYRFYRISWKNASSGAVINNIAMTEKDLSQVADDGYTVDGMSMPMNATTGLFADDGETWSGTLGGSLDANGVRGSGNVYPNGFEGFYAMKYEITQEQYIRFLNKLTADQQKTRTRSDLDELQEGEYVFGSDRTRPSYRNGIVVGARSNGVVIFACNVNPNNPVSQDDDGQTLACNYLTINDMLAYADWAGLRPLSELEYEKMGRRPYPQAPDLKGWAGGSIANVVYPSAFNFSGTQAGGENERLKDGNVNAGGKVQGPVRVGSFASEATNPTEAGASYWGLMDLSGNLAEYYYNANAAGRAFQEHYYGAWQGDGVLATNGNGNVDTRYVPINATALTLRGGHFMSEVKGLSEGEIAISDRSKTRTVKSMDFRDSTATFRLGSSYTYLSYGRTATYKSYLTLENGLNNSKSQVQDSVCVGDVYTIRGSELLDASDSPVQGGGKITYIWYTKEGSYGAWRILLGENGKDLTLTDIRSDRQGVGSTSERFQYVYYRRMAIAPDGALHTTNPVLIYRINPVCEINRLRDTLRMDNSALGFQVSAGLETTFQWRWKAAGDGAGDLKPQQENTTFSWYMPQRSDFEDIAGQTHVVTCKMDFFGKCPIVKEVEVYVEKRAEAAIASDEITLGGNDPKKECGVLMQDMRSQSASRVYKTVKINGKCWMAENLRYDGVTGSGVKSDDPSGEKYGRLYQYSTVVVNNACPSGWRLPTRAELQSLVDYLGGDSYAGAKAKAGNYWAYAAGIKQENTVGFSALGVSAEINNNNGNASYAYFVTSDNTYFRLDYNNNAFRYVSSWGSSYLSIRCIKR